MDHLKRIFIVGQMGAGKGIVGQALAKKLAWRFITADIGMEYLIGRTLNHILGTQGEETFHQCEAEILSYQVMKENTVITTDAGIVVSEQNRKLLAPEFVVYLKVSTPTQLIRLVDKSPLLSVTNQKDFLDKLHRERDKLYEEVANLTIETDRSVTQEDMLRDVDKILNAIGR